MLCTSDCHYQRLFIVVVFSFPSCRFCGVWLSQLSLSALDSQCAKVFMRTLQGPEVQIKTFTFNVLSNDCRGSQVNKMLKKKLNDIVS